MDCCWLVPVATNQPIKNSSCSWDYLSNWTTCMSAVTLARSVWHCAPSVAQKVTVNLRHLRNTTGAAELKPDTPTEYRYGIDRFANSEPIQGNTINNHKRYKREENSFTQLFWYMAWQTSRTHITWYLVLEIIASIMRYYPWELLKKYFNTFGDSKARGRVSQALTNACLATRYSPQYRYILVELHHFAWPFANANLLAQRSLRYEGIGLQFGRTSSVASLTRSYWLYTGIWNHK